MHWLPCMLCKCDKAIHKARHLGTRRLPNSQEGRHLIICGAQKLLQEGRPGAQLRLQPTDQL